LEQSAHSWEQESNHWKQESNHWEKKAKANCEIGEGWALHSEFKNSQVSALTKRNTALETELMVLKENSQVRTLTKRNTALETEIMLLKEQNANTATSFLANQSEYVANVQDNLGNEIEPDESENSSQEEEGSSSRRY
jgi:cell division protein FtsB